VTDDNPFFYNYFKWTNLTFIFNDEGDVNLRFPLGNLVILVMFSFSTITALVFIFYPLLKYKRSGLEIPYAVPMLMYFSLLGLAYIMIEVILIQRFTLFIGYPSRAIAITIFGMLVFSAFGSLLGKKAITSILRLRFLLVLLVFILTLYLVGLSPLLRSLLGLPEWLRIVLSVIIIAPLGLMMGIPFPTGLYQLSVQAEDLIPWAWGVNGVFSVLGSVLVILISMQTSFTVAFGVATLFYLLAYIVTPYLWKAQFVVTKK
jgi:ABC-type multidrug transport system permease subunit